MGYETHLVVARPTQVVQAECVLDMDHPYEDGSGYPAKTDVDGNKITTGRTLVWHEVYSEMNLYKIYGSKLAALHEKCKKAQDKNTVPYFYSVDGNTKFCEDSYGDPVVVVPFKEALKAAKADAKSNDYRRFKWAAEMLESMKAEVENDVVCLFYGS